MNHLVIHHINGDWRDNSLGNVVFMHAATNQIGSLTPFGRHKRDRKLKRKLRSA
jgi:hypothetical protein